MRVLILGASGIIGQHMRLCVPDGVEPIWARRIADLLHVGVDLENIGVALELLDAMNPDAIVNLAGESGPDVVQLDPERYRNINSAVPEVLSEFCRRRNAHYVHVSTQAVFPGVDPPYHADSPRAAVNHYGAQKIEAEQRVERHASHWTIVRPTFVLGVRPMRGVGRMNPLEYMMSPGPQRQVSDRFFSVSFARDVATELWRVAIDEPQMKKIHVGSGCVSRYDLACLAGCDVEPVSHDDFIGVAPRPYNTMYAGGGSGEDILNGVRRCAEETTELESRQREIAVFTGKYDDRLRRGFMALHDEVTANFKRFNPRNDDELLEWYRTTDAYVWELSAYHIDPGFNYAGMCRGVAERLASGKAKTALCLGDGIGDMTLALLRHGIDAVYHDLWGSRTMGYALARIFMHTGNAPRVVGNRGWDPPEIVQDGFDAVVASDFLEHVTDVEKWVKTIARVLKPNGLLFAQNAFNCGSGDDGPMPMHLARNDHFEKDWDPMLLGLGFEQLSSNWYQIKKLEATMAEPYASVASV